MTDKGIAWRVNRYEEKNRALRSFAAALAEPRLDLARMQTTRAQLQQSFGRDTVVDAAAVCAFFSSISRLVDSTNHRQVDSPKSSASKMKRVGVAVIALAVVAAATALVVARR